MSNKKDLLGQRMKAYESTSVSFVEPEFFKDDIIIRLDGKNCSKKTKSFNKPFDELFNACMRASLEYLVENVPGCCCGETHSDEISLCLTLPTAKSEMWYGGNIQKIVSVCASMATFAFNHYFADAIRNFSWEKCERYDNMYYEGMIFDGRAFAIPSEDTANYFIWRQRDCIRNSIEGVARMYYSAGEMFGKSQAELKEMIKAKDDNWDKYDNDFKYGVIAYMVPRAVEARDGIVYRKEWKLTNTTPILKYEICDFMGLYCPSC